MHKYPLLQLINNIGSIYYIEGYLDNSYQYYNRGLNLANEIENANYKTLFTHQLGVVFRDKSEYDKATTYLNKL